MLTSTIAIDDVRDENAYSRVQSSVWEMIHLCTKDVCLSDIATWQARVLCVESIKKK